MRNILFSLFILSFTLNTASAQSNFSESFYAFPHNIHIYIPSDACSDKDLQSALAYKAYIGKLSVLRTYYADINVNLTPLRDSVQVRKKHVVGLGFYNDREGDFFSKARIMGRYSLHLPLQKDLFFSAGTAIHWINYNFHTSLSGVSGSDYSWAGSISCSLYSPGFSLGAAVNDFNNPRLTPISYDFIVRRFFTFYGEKSLSLNSRTKLKGAGRYNWNTANRSTGILQLGFVFSEIAGVNAFYYTGKGKGLTFDLNGIRLFQNYLDFSLAYLIPDSDVYPAASQYELNILWFITGK
jgi:hypothetical protein